MTSLDHNSAEARQRRAAALPKYTVAEALAACAEAMHGDQFAASVVVNKYLLRDTDNVLREREPAQMRARLAREFTRIEQRYPNALAESHIYNELMAERVVPQGSPQSAIGNPFQLQSLSNCFVIQAPVDSYGGIFKTDEQQAQIMKRRGGVGFDLSTLRPKGSITHNAARTSDGVAIFMQRYSNTCREVAQNGRRGALMLSLSVHHPDVLDFANIKRDQTKVTGANVSIRVTDEFMHAVLHDTDYEQRWPVEPPEHIRQQGGTALSAWRPLISKKVRARDVWTNVVQVMRDRNDPGMLFWDTVERMSPADCYADLGFRTVSTNPCVTGDTKILVADGRGAVPIAQLAESGDDVPVYSRDAATNKLRIKWMRRPRKTGDAVPVLKVTIEGGHSVTVTPNHRFVLSDGSEKRADELKEGDSLWIGRRIAATYAEIFQSTKPSWGKHPYFWLRSQGRRSAQPEHRMIWEFHNGPLQQGEAVHHVNRLTRDNRIQNLKKLTTADHMQHHAAERRGAANPIFQIKANPDRFADYRVKMSIATSAEKNGNAYAHLSNDQLRAHMLNLTQQVGVRVSRKCWQAYAREHQLPMLFTTWRASQLGSVNELAVWAARECGLADVEVDPRVQRTLIKALQSGLVAKIKEGRVVVTKACENCAQPFEQAWTSREIAFCSVACSLARLNADQERQEKRISIIRERAAKRRADKRQQVLQAFTALRLAQGVEPTKAEFQTHALATNLPKAFGHRGLYETWEAFKEAAKDFNHRVLSVERIGHADVFNGTVDEDHNYCVVFGEEKDSRGIPGLLLGVTPQCGELPLSVADSCRLLLINLAKFVDAPFTPQAQFNYDRFRESVRLGQRLLDDLIDLEIEAVQGILTKVAEDPEEEELKRVEQNLWQSVLQNAQLGRRTGLGITALGDVIAYLGLRYGSPESIALTDQIYKELALSAYRESVELAKERGPFPMYDAAREVGHPYLERLFEADPELRQQHVMYGRRNVALLTTAPAGSISIELGTTSGMESVFFLEAERKRKINPGDKDARVDYVDVVGDSWQKYTIAHPGVDLWRKVIGRPDAPALESPYAGSTALDIDRMRKVEIQAAAQKWVDHAISNTTTLPEDVTAEEVGEMCIYAWKLGCKGITTYRQNSGEAVISAVPENKKAKEADSTAAAETAASTQADNTPTSTGLGEEVIVSSSAFLSRPAEFKSVPAPIRPSVLPCDVHRASVGGVPYLILVGLLDGRPYELFAGLAEKFPELPKKVRRGILTKRKKAGGVAAYDLCVEQPGDAELLCLADVVERFDNPNYGAFSRVLSLALRHGADVQYICEQLRKDKHSDLFSFAGVIARVLGKNYLADGTQPTQGAARACGSCGSTSLAYQEGCITCYGCGHSKCG